MIFVHSKVMSLISVSADVLNPMCWSCLKKECRMCGIAITSCSEIHTLIHCFSWQNGTEASDTDVNVFQTDRTTAGRVNFSEVAQVATYIDVVLSRGQGN